MTAPILARRGLRLAVLASLQAIPGVTTVESPPVTATQPKQMPYIGLRCGTERKASIAKQLPEFTTTATLEILVRAFAATAEDVQDAIEALANSVELAVLGAPTVIKLLQQVAGVTSTTDISGEGSQYQAECLISMDCEMAEVFEPAVIAPANYPALEGMNVHVDAGRPYDANGVYLSPPFPDSVTPAPRTAGPDGRDEGYITVDLPQ